MCACARRDSRATPLTAASRRDFFKGATVTFFYFLFISLCFREVGAWTKQSTPMRPTFGISSVVDWQSTVGSICTQESLSVELQIQPTVMTCLLRICGPLPHLKKALFRLVLLCCNFLCGNSDCTNVKSQFPQVWDQRSPRSSLTGSSCWRTSETLRKLWSAAVKLLSQANTRALCFILGSLLESVMGEGFLLAHVQNMYSYMSRGLNFHRSQLQKLLRPLRGLRRRCWSLSRVRSQVQEHFFGSHTPKYFFSLWSWGIFTFRHVHFSCTNRLFSLRIHEK